MVRKHETKAIAHCYRSIWISHDCTRLNSFVLPKVHKKENSLNKLIHTIQFFKPGAAWFLRIVSVCNCLYACVCMSAPKAINN